jgi:hypothetical protein
MPGTVISLRDTSSSRARRAISLSRSAICCRDRRACLTSVGTWRGPLREASWPSLLPRAAQQASRPLGCDPAIFSEVTPDRVDEDRDGEATADSSGSRRFPRRAAGCYRERLSLRPAEAASQAIRMPWTSVIRFPEQVLSAIWPKSSAAEHLWCWQMTQEGNAMLWDALILLGLAILVAVTLGGLVYVGPVALLGAPL